MTALHLSLGSQRKNDPLSPRHPSGGPALGSPLTPFLFITYCFYNIRLILKKGGCLR